MRMEYNPRHVTNWLGPWKGFLTGSVVLTSVSILVMTESEFVFLAMVGFILAGIALLFESLLRVGEEIPFLSVVIMFAIGGVVSIFLSMLGLHFVYLAVVIILIIMTYTPRKSLGKLSRKVKK
jgi:phosphotransferase system  glucose/maltose/N-acetylglucosamine-specific IIC component